MKTTNHDRGFAFRMNYINMKNEENWIIWNAFELKTFILMYNLGFIFRMNLMNLRNRMIAQWNIRLIIWGNIIHYIFKTMWRQTNVEVVDSVMFWLYLSITAFGNWLELHVDLSVISVPRKAGAGVGLMQSRQLMK